MSEEESGWFIDLKGLPEDGHGLFQVITLGALYGYGLLFGSDLISNGSELLLLVPSIAGMVGSIVLPVLGAIPDGMIVLFSGLGPDAQQQLSVGVGALAGSTVMLLTIPWVLAVIAGRVNLNGDGKPNYKSKNVPPFSDVSSWGKTGVLIRPEIHKGAHTMIITSSSYLLLQIPGLIYRNKSVEEQAAGEHIWALVGFCLCMIFFLSYLRTSYLQSVHKTDNSKMMRREEIMKAALDNGTISLLGLLKAEFEEEGINLLDPSNIPYNNSKEDENKYGAIGVPKGITTESLANVNSRVARIVKSQFDRYDTSRTCTLEIGELGKVFSDMGENLKQKKLEEWFRKMDTDHNEHIDFQEFVQGVITYVTDPETRMMLHKSGKHHEARHSIGKFNKNNNDDDDNDDEEEEDAEMPEDFVDLPPEEQQSRLKQRSVMLMLLGTLVVLILSDPMCDVLNELGVRLGINPFYVAFILAPLASNASEFLASYSMALKKTSTTMTVSLSALEGAAIMNNTFVLSIFTLLVYIKGLSWEYFAETLAILCAQIAIGILALKDKQTIWDALVVVSVFPISLVFVAVLEGLGWD
jgi:Ca2+/Na+ antiporter